MRHVTLRTFASIAVILMPAAACSSSADHAATEEAASTTTVVDVDYAQQYLDLVAPANCAMEHYSAVMRDALDHVNDWQWVKDNVQPAAQVYAESLIVFYEGVADADWPAAAQDAADKVVDETTRQVRDLQRLANAGSPEDIRLALESYDVDVSGSAQLRAKLGLPSNFASEGSSCATPVPSTSTSTTAGTASSPLMRDWNHDVKTVVCETERFFESVEAVLAGDGWMTGREEWEEDPVLRRAEAVIIAIHDFGMGLTAFSIGAAGPAPDLSQRFSALRERALVVEEPLADIVLTSPLPSRSEFAAAVDNFKALWADFKPEIDSVGAELSYFAGGSLLSAYDVSCQGG